MTWKSTGVSTLLQMPGLLPCPQPSSTLSSCCPSDPLSITHEASFSPHVCLSHTLVGQCHTIPLDPRPRISYTTVKSHPRFTKLLNQACGVPKLERNWWTWKAGDLLPLKMAPLSSARRTSCPVTQEVYGVLVGSQPILACCLRDGHLPAESLSYAHQLVSHQPQTAPPGAQICCCLTWFLTTGLHLTHLVVFISCGNNTYSIL